MDLQQLKKFLVKATLQGYADSGEQGSKKELDGSKTFEFSEGDWMENDNYFGGEPFGGREVVWYQQKPYWMCVYYGSDTGKASGLIPFLCQALTAIPDEMPVRGPKELVDGKFRYVNSWEGDLEKFSGEEIIFYDEQEVYKAHYVGGLIDQRTD